MSESEERGVKEVLAKVLVCACVCWGGVHAHVVFQGVYEGKCTPHMGSHATAAGRDGSA